MSQLSLYSRLFRRPPHVTTFGQWVVWRTQRNVNKLSNRCRRWWYSLKRTARSRVMPDVTLRVHPGLVDYVSQSIVLTGVWEPVETEIMLRLLGPGATVVDIGANIGYHTVLASRLVGPSGRVLAFEPEPRNRALLMTNVARNRCDNVDVFPNAVSDVSGETIRLHLATENLGDHRIYADPDDAERRCVTVETTTLDDIVDGAQVEFIKMDIQGAEGRALAGMERTLRDNRNLVLLLEFWPQGLRLAGTAPENLLARLVGAGFRLRVARTDQETDAVPLAAPAMPAEILAMIDDDDPDDHVNVLAVGPDARVDALDADTPELQPIPPDRR